MLSGSAAVVVAVLGLLALVLSAASVSALLLALRRLLDRSARPWLPEDDRPPAGLGRLVPVGAQVDEEARRGFVALENWLLQRRSGR